MIDFMYLINYNPNYLVWWVCGQLGVLELRYNAKLLPNLVGVGVVTERCKIRDNVPLG